MSGCLQEGAVYASAAAVGAGAVGAGAGLAPVVGGIYGCLGPGGGWAALQEGWRDARRAWRLTSSLVERAWRWLTRKEKKSRWVKIRPLTTAEAMALVAHSFEHRPGPRLYLPRGSRWERVAIAEVLTPEVIAGVYGEELAASADPEALARLWWGFWGVTLSHRETWDAQTRLLYTILRVGDYLTATAPGPIEAWPFMPPSQEKATSSEASRAPLEILVAQTGPEQPVARGGAPEAPPEAALWTFLGLTLGGEP